MPVPPGNRIRAFAELGAAVRLRQLREEIQHIYKAFPALRFQNRQYNAPDIAGSHEGGSRRRKRRTFTAAERKLIGERMRKYWAARRKK
jgi:hypothetical protein